MASVSAGHFVAKAASRCQTPDALSPRGSALGRKEAGTWQKALGCGQPELGCSSGVTATCLSSRVPASCSGTFQTGISLQAGSVGLLNEKLLLADSPGLGLGWNGIWCSGWSPRPACWQVLGG